MQTRISLDESKLDDNEFYDKIASDSKQVLIQLISEAGHGKTSSLRTIIDYCRKKHPDIVFKIFDVSQAWFHCAPTKYRQYITREKWEKKQVANIDDCVYEIGALSDEEKRVFVGSIIGLDYKKRYQMKMDGNGKLDNCSSLVYVFEESNIYFGSYSFRRNDMFSPVFQAFVSVGRNYKMRGFLIATAEIGEMAPSLRRRSRKIYGRLESEGDIGVVRRKNKELAQQLICIPKYHFVYLSDKPYGPVQVPDVVKNVPQDYVVEVKEVEKVTLNGGWWIQFLLALIIFGMFAWYIIQL